MSTQSARRLVGFMSFCRIIMYQKQNQGLIGKQSGQSVSRPKRRPIALRRMKRLVEYKKRFLNRACRKACQPVLSTATCMIKMLFFAMATSLVCLTSTNAHMERSSLTSPPKLSGGAFAIPHTTPIWPKRFQKGIRASERLLRKKSNPSG